MQTEDFGFVLLDASKQEVPQGNVFFSRLKHLTQVSPNRIKSTVPIDGDLPRRCAVISEQRKGDEETKKTCSRLKASV